MFMVQATGYYVILICDIFFKRGWSGRGGGRQGQAGQAGQLGFFQLLSVITREAILFTIFVINTFWQSF
jgi:hypothetical protein